MKNPIDHALCQEARDAYVYANELCVSEGGLTMLAEDALLTFMLMFEGIQADPSIQVLATKLAVLRAELGMRKL